MDDTAAKAAADRMMRATEDGLARRKYGKPTLFNEKLPRYGGPKNVPENAASTFNGAPSPQDPPDIPKVKRNIKRLIEQNAPEEDIDQYVASEGVTFEQLKAHKSTPQELSWSDVPGQALQNAPESAARTAYALIYPFLHPIDTANAVAGIGKGAASKIAGAVGMEQDPQSKAQTEAHIDAIGKFFLDRYGSVENLKQTLAKDPVGAMADFAAVLSGGGTIAAKAPGIIGKAGQAVAKVGSAIDPLANVGRAARVPAKGMAAVLGMTTGTGTMPLQTAFKAGRTGNKTFTENMRGQAPITDTLDMAKDAMSSIRKDRSDAYTSAMTGMKANTTPIDYTPVLDAVRKAYDDIGYKGIAKSQDAVKTYHAIGETVDQFHKTAGANTIEGLDALKQAIGEIRTKTLQGTLERRVADNVFNAVKDQIVKQAPEYAAAMKGYSQASDQINDLTKTFSLGEKASKDTAIRKLTSVTRNNVNTNYGRRTQLMDELAQKQPDLPYAIAGQAMNTLTPRGLQGQMAASGAGVAALASNPWAAALLPATSPRVVGEVAHGAGQVMGGIDALSPELLAQILRASYITNQTTQPALMGTQDVGADTPEELKRKRLSN